MCNLSPTSAQKLMFQIGSFKPSDRRAIRQAILAEGGESMFVEALMEFLKRWEEADWLEDYNVERVAIWSSINVPRTLRAEISRRIQSLLDSGGASSDGAFMCFLSTLSTKETSNAVEQPSAN